MGQIVGKRKCEMLWRSMAWDKIVRDAAGENGNAGGNSVEKIVGDLARRIGDLRCHRGQGHQGKLQCETSWGAAAWGKIMGDVAGRINSMRCHRGQQCGSNL